MTMVLDAQAALPEATLPASVRQGADADTLEEMIGAHREALLDLAPRQEEHTARVEAGWHMAELGLLLRVRDSRPNAIRHTPNAKESAAPGSMQDRERQWENTKTDRRRR